LVREGVFGEVGSEGIELVVAEFLEGCDLREVNNTAEEEDEELSFMGESTP